MPPIGIILSHTPLWVWGLFLFLAFIGVNATFERTRSLPNLFILPFVFLTIKITNLQTAQLPLLFSGLIGGIIIGWFSAL